MKRQKKKGQTPINQDELNAFLGRGAELTGTLRFEGTARVDGALKGEIITSGTLIVGDTALIEGNIRVDTIILSGKIRGNIIAKSRIEANQPGKIIGDISAPILVIQEGVIFEGSSMMVEKGERSNEKDSRSSLLDNEEKSPEEEPIELEDLVKE